MNGTFSWYIVQLKSWWPCNAKDIELTHFNEMLIHCRPSSIHSHFNQYNLLCNAKEVICSSYTELFLAPSEAHSFQSSDFILSSDLHWSNVQKYDCSRILMFLSVSWMFKWETVCYHICLKNVIDNYMSLLCFHLESKKLCNAALMCQDLNIN